MQRHHHERVDVEAQRGERRAERETEGAAERAGAAILQRLHVIVEWCGIDERCDERIDVPGRAAAWTPGHRSREAAAGARLAHAGEAAGADGTEPARRRTAARGASLDEQCIPHP